MLRHQLIMAVPANRQTLQLLNWCILMLRKEHQLRQTSSSLRLSVQRSCLCRPVWLHAAVTQHCYSNSDALAAGDGTQDAVSIEIRVEDAPKTTFTAVKHTGECILVRLELMFWIEAEVLAVVASHHLNLRLCVLSAGTFLW